MKENKDQDELGKFKKGNEIWKLVKPENKGRPKLYATPELLWKKAIKYFKWIDSNPIIAYQNLGTKNVNRIEFQRPYLLEGLLVFLDMDDSTFYNYRDEHADYIDITRKIELIIKNNKFEGAVVGIYKENIISRSLGLKDKKDVTTDGNALNLTPTYQIVESDKGLASSEDEVDISQ